MPARARNARSGNCSSSRGRLVFSARIPDDARARARLPSLGVCGLVDGDVDETTWGAFISLGARSENVGDSCFVLVERGVVFRSGFTRQWEFLAEKNCGLEDVILYSNKNV